MPLSVLSQALDKFRKALIAASGMALPAGGDPASGWGTRTLSTKRFFYSEADKNAVKKALEGSLVKLNSDAYGYIPILRSPAPRLVTRR